MLHSKEEQNCMYSLYEANKLVHANIYQIALYPAVKMLRSNNGHLTELVVSRTRMKMSICRYTPELSNSLPFESCTAKSDTVLKFLQT